MEGEIIQYENKIKNYTKEEKELFVTPKEIFINSVIDKYKLPLFITYRNNQGKINQENKDNLYIIEKQKKIIGGDFLFINLFYLSFLIQVLGKIYKLT